MKRVRTITTYEGVYINSEDVKALTQDEQILRNCLAMLVVGYERHDPLEIIMRQALGYVLFTASGKIKGYEVLAHQVFWFTDGDGI